MYARKISSTLKQLAEGFPVVAITGPRQSGKTTLARSVFPNKPYINLEAPDIRLEAESDPRRFLSQFRDGAILDEVQNVPSLFSYIQVIVDENEKKGEFILTGSHQFSFHNGLSQSLAGRVALLSLLPMSVEELQQAGINYSINEFMLRGGYPRIYKDGLNPTTVYRSYYQTYLERDVRALIALKDLSQFQKFIRLCAGRVGQLLNLSSLSNDVGVSLPTIKHWISVLEASYLLIRISPYFENVGKRLVKSPKLFFADVGLACYLLGIESIEQLERDPLRGALFENFIFLELYKARANAGHEPRIYFYRDQSGFEVDFILERQRRLLPLEVKSAETFTPNFIKNIQTFQKLVGEKSGQGYIVYGGEREFTIGGIEIRNFKSISVL